MSDVELLALVGRGRGRRDRRRRRLRRRAVRRLPRRAAADRAAGEDGLNCFTWVADEAADAPRGAARRACRWPSRTSSAPRACRASPGSRMLEGYLPPYTATVGAPAAGGRRDAAAKTNQDEFAMGSSTENSAFGPARNPWDRERVPGRLLGRQRRGRSGGPGAVGARHRHRRLDPPAGRAVRDRRAQTDLRIGLALRDDRVRLLARPGRPADARRDATRR